VIVEGRKNLKEVKDMRKRELEPRKSADTAE